MGQTHPSHLLLQGYICAPNTLHTPRQLHEASHAHTQLHAVPCIHTQLPQLNAASYSSCASTQLHIPARSSTHLYAAPRGFHASEQLHTPPHSSTASRHLHTPPLRLPLNSQCSSCLSAPGQSLSMHIHSILIHATVHTLSAVGRLPCAPTHFPQHLLGKLCVHISSPFLGGGHSCLQS